MQEEVDDNGEPLFKHNEYLDALQIKSLLYRFTQIDKKKDPLLTNNKKKKTKTVKKKQKPKLKGVAKVKLESDGGDEIGETTDKIEDTNKQTDKVIHPIILDEIVICDLAKSINNTSINEQSPLNHLKNTTIVSIAEMVGSDIRSKDLSARDRKKQERLCELESAIVTYVTNNCSC